MLDCASNALDREPGHMYQSNDPRKSIGLVLVTNRLLVNVRTRKMLAIEMID